MTGYHEFLESKKIRVEPCGIDIAVSDMNPQLFEWQKAIVRWALRRGRAALFEDCGLGKTPQQLEWSRHVCAAWRQPSNYAKVGRRESLPDSRIRLTRDGKQPIMADE